jgi:hypothetical protein
MVGSIRQEDGGPGWTGKKAQEIAKITRAKRVEVWIKW